jgi:hypothetical protein
MKRISQAKFKKRKFSEAHSTLACLSDFIRLVKVKSIASPH